MLPAAYGRKRWVGSMTCLFRAPCIGSVTCGHCLLLVRHVLARYKTAVVVMRAHIVTRQDVLAGNYTTIH